MLTRSIRIHPIPSLTLGAALAIALAGCEERLDPNANGGKGSVPPYELAYSREIWTDPETGCQYHFWQNRKPIDRNYAMALAPRLGADGKPLCNAGRADR